MKPDLRISPWLSAIVGCVETTFTDAEIDLLWLSEVSGNGVDASPILVGERGSMAWVRLGAVTPATAAQGQGTRCSTRLLVTVEAGFLTCYPVPDDGSCVEPAEQALLSATVNAAMLALLKAIICCDWHVGATAKPDVNLIGWTPNGPQGAVIGGVWTFQFEV